MFFYEGAAAAAVKLEQAQFSLVEKSFDQKLKKPQEFQGETDRKTCVFTTSLSDNQSGLLGQVGTLCKVQTLCKEQTFVRVTGKVVFTWPKLAF